MHRLALIACFLVGCGTDPVADTELAAETDSDILDGKADGSWGVAPTLHVGEHTHGFADAGGRRVFPLWLDAGTTIDVVATATDGGSVRVAVLGPLRGGTRDVIAAAGYTTPRGNIELTFDGPERGEYLVVLGSHGLSTATSFQLATHRADCTGCTGSETDILATPKVGALVGLDRLVSMELGAVLDARDFDVEAELWASPPGLPWAATKVATSVASGSQINVIVPDSVMPADDLTIVVREAGGRVLDTGVVTRFAPELRSVVRTDALLYGDLVSVQASGISGYFEGVLSLSMRSETRGLTIAEVDVKIDRPGQVGNGFGAFDATFAPELADDAGVLNPNLPTNGELLSIGKIDGNGGYRRLACFEYCNDLSGQETCTGGTRACP